MPGPTVRAYLSRLGRKGGAAKSEAKAKAARKNGKKGGRPPAVPDGRGKKEE